MKKHIEKKIEKKYGVLHTMFYLRNYYYSNFPNSLSDCISKDLDYE